MKKITILIACIFVLTGCGAFQKETGTTLTSTLPTSFTQRILHPSATEGEHAQNLVGTILIVPENMEAKESIYSYRPEGFTPALKILFAPPLYHVGRYQHNSESGLTLNYVFSITGKATSNQLAEIELMDIAQCEIPCLTDAQYQQLYSYALNVAPAFPDKTKLYWIKKITLTKVSRKNISSKDIYGELSSVVNIGHKQFFKEEKGTTSYVVAINAVDLKSLPGTKYVENFKPNVLKEHEKNLLSTNVSQPQLREDKNTILSSINIEKLQTTFTTTADLTNSLKPDKTPRNNESEKGASVKPISSEELQQLFKESEEKVNKDKDVLIEMHMQHQKQPDMNDHK